MTPAWGVNAQRPKQESPSVDKERATAYRLIKVFPKTKNGFKV